MKKLTLTRAFATYGAHLRNVRWASSSIARDGSLVLSCWDHFFTQGRRRYEDRLSRWPTNHPGRALLGEHLSMAIDGALPVRLVVAKLDDSTQWISGAASPLPKTFSTEQRLIGKVSVFDGDFFAIDFR